MPKTVVKGQNEMAPEITSDLFSILEKLYSLQCNNCHKGKLASIFQHSVVIQYQAVIEIGVIYHLKLVVPKAKMCI